jgi:hypothetical protein
MKKEDREFNEDNVKDKQEQLSDSSGEKGMKASKKVLYEIEILPQVVTLVIYSTKDDSCTKLFMVALISNSCIYNLHLSSTNAVVCLYIVKHNIHLANSEGFWTSDYHNPYDVVISLAFVIILLQRKSDL